MITEWRKPMGLGQLPPVPQNWTGIPEPPGWSYTGLPWPPTEANLPKTKPPACDNPLLWSVWPCNTDWLIVPPYGPKTPPPGWPASLPWPLPAAPPITLPTATPPAATGPLPPPPVPAPAPSTSTSSDNSRVWLAIAVVVLVGSALLLSR